MTTNLDALVARLTPKPRKHDSKHPYVMQLIGCGHGMLFKDRCIDCDIVGVHEQYRHAVATVSRCKDRLRVLAAERAALQETGK